MKLKFSLKFLFLLLLIVAVVLWYFDKPPSLTEHNIPIYPGFRFASESVEATEFGEHYRWSFTTKAKLENIKEFYDDAFSAEKYNLHSSINKLDAEPSLFVFTQESQMAPVNLVEKSFEWWTTSIKVIDGQVTIEKITFETPTRELHRSRSFAQ